MNVWLKVVWVGSVLVVGTKRDKRVRFPPEPLVMCGASFDHCGFCQNVATTTFYLAQVAFLFNPPLPSSRPLATRGTVLANPGSAEPRPDRPRWKRLRAVPPNPFLEKNKSVTKIGELTHRLEGRKSTGVGKQTYER